MNILVLIKQVPQSESATTIRSDSPWILRSDHTNYKMNRFDEYAVEEALLLKEAHSDVRVDVLSLGPERAKETIKRALGMGADEGCHLKCPDKAYIDPNVVAKHLADQAATGDYDLIVCGIMSEDLMQSQTGAMVAAHLNLPCVTSVIDLDFNQDKHGLDVVREIEGGTKARMSVSLPCVITVQAGINTPRYPSLSKILKANSKTIQSVDVSPGGGSTRCLSITFPQKKRDGRILQGSRHDQAREFIDILRQKQMMR